MIGVMDVAVDPVSGIQIGENDVHFNIVRFYYNMLPIYQKEYADKLDAFNKRWKDYQIEYYLNPSNPPAFKPNYKDYTYHVITLDKNYMIQTVLKPVLDAAPTDPDPTKFTARVLPGPYPQDYEIVPIGVDSHGQIASSSSGVTLDQVKTFLKGMPPTDVMTLISQILNG